VVPLRRRGRRGRRVEGERGLPLRGGHRRLRLRRRRRKRGEGRGGDRRAGDDGRWSGRQPTEEAREAAGLAGGGVERERQRV